MNATDPTKRLYIWLDGDPESSAADVSIPNEPGVSDLEQIARAAESGALGRYLPVNLRFSDHPTPTHKRVRSLDTAKLLRDRRIRHRRRYEVLLPDDR
jgi:hypothetical protein